MKRQSIVFRGILDGTISAVLLDVLVQFIVSPYCGIVNADGYLIALLFALVTSFVSASFLKHEVKIKALFIFFCWSALSFLGVLALCFLNYLTVRLSWFPVGDVSSGNGFYLVLSAFIFIGLSLVLKIAAICFLFYKNRKER